MAVCFNVGAANRLNLMGFGEMVSHQFLPHFSCSTTYPMTSELDREDRFAECQAIL